MNTIFLQQSNGGGSGFLIMMVAMFAVVYFFMILPQKRKQKKEKAYIDEIKVGQSVVTTSGIHARVLEVGDTTVILETNAGKIKFEKSAIAVDLTQKIYENKQ